MRAKEANDIVPKKSLTNRSMASSYTRTAGETPAARLLISLSAGVLANHRVLFHGFFASICTTRR